MTSVSAKFAERFLIPKKARVYSGGKTVFDFVIVFKFLYKSGFLVILPKFKERTELFENYRLVIN